MTKPVQRFPGTFVALAEAATIQRWAILVEAEIRVPVPRVLRDLISSLQM